MRPSYQRRVTPADVGRRVTVRRWVEDTDRGMVPSDVVGLLRSYEEGMLLIERRTGETVAVPDATVLASRVVPDS